MLNLSQRQKQVQTLAPRQMQALKLLATSLPELRAEIVAEMNRNPAIEDVDRPLETSMSEIEERREQEAGEPDYPEDDFTPGVNYDEEAAERRQSFFDNQVKEETLQEHLLAQLATSDIVEDDWPMAEVLIGDLDENGYYRGSIPDVMTAFQRTKEQVVAALGKLMEFDPPGCGARTPKECLLAQMDNLYDSPYEDDVRAIITDHLEDLAAGRYEVIEKKLDLTPAQFKEAVRLLRTLDGRPGRQYQSVKERVEYINPEVHAVKREGRWIAETDERSLPEIHLSKTFAALLEDPKQTAETKAYVKERIAAAQAFREAIQKRQKTVQDIAQAIFDRQQEFFEKGLSALKPLTELEVAEKVGVHSTTVSRTVRDKYASTPQGTFELRRFFASGVTTAAGEAVSQTAILAKLREIVDNEDETAPLSDEKIAVALKEAGFPVARRTVAKYRDKLHIPGTSDRRRKI